MKGHLPDHPPIVFGWVSRGSVRLFYPGLVPMKCASPLLISAIVLLCAGAASCETSGIRATFRESKGNEIEVNTRTSIFRTPQSTVTKLDDCSNAYQTCLTDHHGFAFAYFRNCNDVKSADYEKLRFAPRVISALHEHIWLAFDAAPTYMFHYVIHKGIVGIYLGPKSYDFRASRRATNFDLSKLDGLEYRIVGSGGVAACTE